MRKGSVFLGGFYWMRFLGIGWFSVSASEEAEEKKLLVLIDVPRPVHLPNSECDSAVVISGPGYVDP